MSLRTDRSHQPLAIIGMACRLPGAESLDQYWDLIVHGRSAVGEVPPERFDQRLYYVPQKGVRGKSYSKLAALLSNRDFDHQRNPIPEDLRRSVDNTHLLMTGVAADALRHAGLDPFNLPLRNTGIFIGHAQGSSLLGQLTYRAYLEEAVALLADEKVLGNLPADRLAALQAQFQERAGRHLPEVRPNVRNLNCNMVAGTLAKAFGLNGPWLALNSACASSLHAMLLGARALQLGRADMVIVGGASDCKTDSLVLFSQAQTLSTSDSRPFDSDADGLIMSEGYVSLVMKTLDRALADGDPIQAVVRGLGVASDGRGKSLWAPRKEGQMKAMLRAYRSGLDMAGLQYLEAHATSTQVGDATELETLGEVLGPKFPAGKKIPVTSVKANIGHTLECAGIAGVIKTVLCMQHQTIPPAINIRSLNNKVDWQQSPYYIPTAPAAWNAPAPGQPRRAAVNAFGIGGLNMHVVLDEFTPAARTLVSAPQPVETSPEDRAIAIVGMGCVLPGANSLRKYWEALTTGADPKIAPPAERWTHKALAEQAQRPQSTVGGFITDFEYDWRRHKVPPKQVAEADPLQFMLLEAAEQALLDAGYDPKKINRETCGVVVGTEFGGDFCDHLEMGLRLPEMQDTLSSLLGEQGLAAQAEQATANFAEVLLRKWPSLVDETGSFTSSTLASRITKTLDLAGGAVSIDSGATSGLSGLSICVDMLLSGDNDLMICAAGQRRMGPNFFEALDEAGLLARHGQPRQLLDAGYDGIVPAEGVSVVVLKRLADARRDGDKIHAVIRGLGIAHHAEHAEALRVAAQRAAEMAGIAPTEITLAEVDTDEQLSPAAEELRALVATHAGPQRQKPLVLGSLTAQFGHLGGGSGIASLIKASLEIERGEAAPVVGLNAPAPALAQAGNAIRLPQKTEKLTGRRFGALACWSKGQACYLILEPGVPQPAEEPPTSAARPAAIPQPAAQAHDASTWTICRFAAPSQAALLAQLGTLSANAAAAWQKAQATPGFGPGDAHRLAIVADSPATLARKLQLAAGQLANPNARGVLEQQGVFYRELPATRPRVAFAFPGQGSQYDGMLRELVRVSPAAAKRQSEIDATMRRLGYPTFDELAWATPTQLGKDVWITQVSMLLADALVLAALDEIGVQADIALGHSYGEFAALYAAGAWDLETAIRMTRARCDGIAAAATGGTGMLATDASAELVASLSQSISPELFPANLNAPDQTVVGGRLPHLEALAQALQSQAKQAKILSVPAAFHTPLMVGASRLLAEQLRGATLAPLRIPVISTVTNTPVRDLADVRRNLAAQLTTPVRYAQLIAELGAQQPTVFVEVGPQQTLTRLNRRNLPADANAIATDNPKKPGLEPLLSARALLEVLGCAPVASAAKPAAASTSAIRPAAPSPLTPSPNPSEQRTMSDDLIPHFDATERRRAKMRSSATGKPSNGHAPPPAAAPPIRPAAPAQAHTNGAGPAAPAPVQTPPRATAPVAASPPPAAKPAAAPPPVAQQPASQPAASAPVANKPAAPAPAELETFLINFVVEQTGYPAEVVELDADLEADLGIDSIKKAQLFGELQEYFEVGTSATTLSLDDFPTLRHVLQFLQGLGSTETLSASAATSAAVDSPAPRQAPAQAAPASPAPAPAAVAAPSANMAASAAPAARPAQNPAELESFLINFVVEQTGYPAEVVDLDSDLEADLGIDSIKKAQLFGELQEYFDVGTSATTLSLDDFPTLRHVLDFLQQAGSASATAPPQPVAAAPAPAPLQQPASVEQPAIEPPAPPTAQAGAAPARAGAPVGNPAELESFLINFVVEQTGYPAEVVDLDSDLEADLGIDSIKKAQLFGELQEYFEIGATATTLSLDDFPTLRHVLDFLLQAGSDSPAPASSPVVANHVSATADPAPAVADSPTPQAPATVAAPSGADAAALETFLINFVVEQTGYPPEVVDLDSDLEADLGVDSIKKAQLFGELQEYFDVGTSATNLSLDDFPTLRHVLNFLVDSGASGANCSPSPAQPAPVAQSPVQPADTENQSVELSGTPYELGFAHGQQHRREILRLLQLYAARTDQEVGELPGYADAAAWPSLLSADELEELQGIADAVQVPLGNLVAHHLAQWSEIGYGAGQLATTAGHAEAARALVALRQPAPLSAALAEAFCPELLVRRPVGGLSHIAAMPLGTVGILAGMNAAGVAVSAFPTEDNTQSQPLGRRSHAVARAVLEHAADLSSAEQIARSFVGGQSWTLCVVQAQAERALLLECDGQTVTVAEQTFVHAGNLSVPRPAEMLVPAGYRNGHAASPSASLPPLGVDSTEFVALLSAPPKEAEPAFARISPVDNREHFALVIEPARAELWIAGGNDWSPRQIHWNAPRATGASPDAWAPTAGDPAQPELSPQAVTTRFAMEMRDAPLPTGSALEPAWSGAAVVLGSGPVADALTARLQAAGVDVSPLNPAAPLEEVLEQLDTICQAGAAPHLFITSARDVEPGHETDEQVWQERHHAAIVAPFFVCQRWAQLAAAGNWLDRATLVATTALGGDFGLGRGAPLAAGGALTGLLKAIYIEYAVMQKLPGFRVKAIDAPASEDPQRLVDHIWNELAAGRSDYEVAYVGDSRRVPFAVERPTGSRPNPGVRPRGNWVVTGGARGITAACALELGRRFGLKLHLLGTTPPPAIDPAWRTLDAEGLQRLKAPVMIAARQNGQPAAQAWERVQKDLEIDRSLQAFAQAGVQITYHACDVSNRTALAQTLDRIRAAHGPISGILHGAGIDRSCRFDRKQRDVVLQTIGAKVDGAANLMALTRRDPVRHFLGFGSISGRLGSFGQTDYCLSSDLLCKLIGAYRRERPWVHAVGFHWHPWDEVGMAARPETKSVLQGKSDLRLMPLAEGITHLVRELLAGTPEAEVLITERRHWERFAAGLDNLREPTIQPTHSQPTNGQPVAAPAHATNGSSAKAHASAPAIKSRPAVAQPQPAPSAPDEPFEPVELKTHRCQLQALAAPLPSNTPAAPRLAGAAWVLGDNPAARQLVERLRQLGCPARQIGTLADPEATLAEVERLWAEQPAAHLFLMTGRDELTASLLDERYAAQRRQRGVLLPFLVAQRWYKLLSAKPELGRGSLVAAISLGGDFGFSGQATSPEGGALAGLLKAVHIEDSRREASRVRAKVVDASASEPIESLIDSLLRELAAAEPEVEVCWSAGQRRVIRPLPVALPTVGKSRVPRGGVWVVTGGARGITAIAARELARRYGWTLHLVGKSPPPQADAPWRHYDDAQMKSLKTTLARQAVAEGRSPSEAWDRVMKDVEIFNNLRQFSDAGVQATYHACDISDRAALARVLDEVRRADGPITGILHGAGVIDPSRFENKRRDIVESLIGAKVSGTLHLMALTVDDPLGYFIGFGSISGRFGGNGLSDYAAGNDALAKLIDWHRAARPDCASTCIHWESWEGSGMATLPRFAWGPKSVMNMKYMLPEEGVRRLELELAAGLPDSEVLYTFGDFYPMFYPHEQRPLGPFVPGALAEGTQATAAASPLLRNVRQVDAATLGDVPLEPTADAFLIQHRLRDKPLLPVVVGLEALAEAAAASAGKPARAFRNVQMVDGLLFHTDRAVTAQSRATPQADGAFACELTCDFRNRNGGLIQKDRPYLRALVETGEAAADAVGALPPLPTTWTDFSYPDDAPVYHGPAFRGVTGIHYDRNGGWGRIVALPLASLVGAERTGGWTVPSAALDAALYACGIHLWMHGEGAVSLPKSIDRLQLGRPPREGETCHVHFTCREIARDSAHYDFTLVGEDGALLVAAQGYRKVILGRGGAQ